MTERTMYPWGELPPIRIYNSMTRREEEFPPVDEHPEVSIYVCGPTTYSFVHIGNMRNPVFYDVVRRIFKAHGYRVKFVTNFTDIDDKMIAEAKRIGEDDPIQLSARFVHEYYTDLFGLGIDKADFYPKVSTHITEIVDYVKLIMNNGHAYVGKDGSVYFDVKSYPDYLKLSGHSMDALLENITQGEEQKAKNDPRDFALWKATAEDEVPRFEFPQSDEEIEKFGKVSRGRPGWHIECSVMSAKYLGPSFDIHGGGKELKFPHHENELAQSKCGHPKEDFARIWMHNEWVILPSGEKMAKSGESVLIRDVLKNHDPDTVRMFILSGHYRKEIAYSTESLDDQAKAKARIVETFRRLTEFLRWRAEERHENWLQIWREFDKGYFLDSYMEKKEGNDYPINEYLKCMADGSDFAELRAEHGANLVRASRDALFKTHQHLANDFNTQGVFGELFNLLHTINANLEHAWYGDSIDFKGANIALGTLVYMTEILGILKSERDRLYLPDKEREEIAKGGGDAAKLADVLLKLREDARAEKKFQLADQIRDRLLEIGAEIRDLKDGSKIVWK